MTTKGLLAMLFIALFLCANASAQTTVFTHQGRLTNNGAPANGNHDFEFRLFDALIGGTQQSATVQKLNVAVANGIYVVSLDFAATVLPGADRFLDISVRAAGGGAFTPLTPRQQVTSAPYAIQSLNAGTANSLSASCVGCVTAAQIGAANVPAGSGSYIQNTNSPQASSNFNVSGNGTIGGNLVATGNVGIGTTNPAGQLHVRGVTPVRILGDPTTLSGNEWVDFMARSSVFSSDLGGMRIQRQTSAATMGDIDTIFLAATKGSSASEKMRITGRGEVIIGTSSAGFPFPGSLTVGGAAVIGYQGGRSGMDPGDLQVLGNLLVGELGSGGNISLCRNSSEVLSTCSSSGRYKTNIRPFISGLSLLNRLRPVSFIWRADSKPDIGLVAEDVAQVEPLLTTTDDKGEIEGVKYDRLNVVLINAVKEQQTQIELMQKRVEQQREEIAALKALVCLQNPAAGLCRQKD